MDQNIATRLKLFLEHVDLTSSQFADKCGIARPTLSQILTGRNKKISDVLIGQIHYAFPNMSILWLLFGEGEMMVHDREAVPDGSDNGSDITISAHEDAAGHVDGMEIAVNSAQDTVNSHANQHVGSVAPTAVPRVEIMTPPPVVRKISHITVYYDDSTFETFYPKDK